MSVPFGKTTAPAAESNVAPRGSVRCVVFGNLKGYPEARMEARDGLVGAANGGTLFLDESGELPEKAQAQVLRVMDPGEYLRVGESKPRRVDVRVVGATNIRTILLAAIHESSGDKLTLLPEMADPASLLPEPRVQASTTTAQDDARKEEIETSIDEKDGNISAAAETLGMSRGALYRLIEKYGIERDPKPKR